MELTDISIDAIVTLAKQKQTKLCLVPKILLKRLRQLMNNHTASLEITVSVHESMLSQ